MAISKRLGAILALAKGAHTLADIGTDHAYLAIAAIEQNICHQAIACDINPGPLHIAKKNIAQANLTQAIETRLGNGLAPLRPQEADTIVIAGMGGMLILKILEAEMPKAQFAKKLILSPQHDLPLVRKSLHQLGFYIAQEVLVHEDGRFYIVLEATHTGECHTWTEQEYFLGKHLKNSPHWPSYLNHQADKINRYIDHLKAKETALQQLQWIEESR